MDEMNQMPASDQTPKAGGNGKVILGIIVVLVVAAVIYFMSAAPTTQEADTSAAETQDTTEVISEEINKVDLEGLDASLDADLEAIDEQLNSL
jgi:uncharacterized protein HemX